MLCVDYCNAILAAAVKTTTNRLQWVLNAPARVVSDTKKFDQGLSRLMHQELHWLDISEWVNYKLGVLTHRCLLGKAPVYLSNCCIPVSQVATQWHLRSAARQQLTVPRHRLSTYGRLAFAVAGPTMFNTLPDDLWDPAVSTLTFGLGTCEASRFDLNSNRTSRFDSKVTGRFENFESQRLPRLPSYHKQHSLFNDKFQSFRYCYWDLYWV